MAKKVSVSLVQRAPVYLNLKASVNLAVQYITESVSRGAEVIVFPETWLPGYPVWLDYAPEAALWDHPPAKALFRLLFENSISINDAHFNELLHAAKINNCLIVMGCHERVGRTLYNTIFYFRPDGTFHLHRKLMPTYTERLIWGYGDGSTLPVFEFNDAKIGGLICWEHWMPLARAAMHQQNEDIHIAQWPMVKELHHLASRNYAFEGQCFVIASGCTLTKSQMIDGISSVCENEEDELALNLIEHIPTNPQDYMLKGGSAIIKPNSEYLVEPILERSELIFADLDLKENIEGNLFIDTAGHYSRPDIFKLQVDTQSKLNQIFED